VVFPKVGIVVLERHEYSRVEIPPRTLQPLMEVIAARSPLAISCKHFVWIALYNFTVLTGLGRKHTWTVYSESLRGGLITIRTYFHKGFQPKSRDRPPMPLQMLQMLSPQTLNDSTAPTTSPSPFGSIFTTAVSPVFTSPRMILSAKPFPICLLISLFSGRAPNFGS
jgi:hypothetical protein